MFESSLSSAARSSAEPAARAHPRHGKGSLEGASDDSKVVDMKIFKVFGHCIFGENVNNDYIGLYRLPLTGK